MRENNIILCGTHARQKRRKHMHPALPLQGGVHAPCRCNHAAERVTDFFKKKKRNRHINYYIALTPAHACTVYTKVTQKKKCIHIRRRERSRRSKYYFGREGCVCTLWDVSDANIQAVRLVE
jgi:hypothetical protein